MLLQKRTLSIRKFFLLLFIGCTTLSAQQQLNSVKDSTNNSGWFSLGARSTISTFSDDGTGIGTGGQFRIQLSNRVNTDWFVDYILINRNNIRSEYYHIGWSVLYYPFKNLQFPKHTLQPFILAGHCFDYNQKTVLSNPSITKDRWGSAIQGGIGLHFNLSNRFDITLMTQYMLHLTKELEIEDANGTYKIKEHEHAAFEGHFLTTASVNYKIGKLWKK